MSSPAPSGDNPRPSPGQTAAAAYGMYVEPTGSSTKLLVHPAVPLFTVLLATFLRAATDPWIGAGPPFVFYILAVLTSAWYRGRNAGLQATALSVAAGWILFVPPRYELIKGSMDAAFRLCVFTSLSVAASVITARIRRMQEEALAAESRFRRTFENASVGLAQLSLDGRWLWVNRRLCAITGYSEAELLGQSISAVAADGDIVSALRRAAGAGVATERRLRRKYNEVVWVNISVTQQRYEAEGLDQLIAVIEDITSRKNAEDALRVNLLQLQSTFEGMAEPALLASPDGKVLALNAAYMDLFEMEEMPRTRAEVLRNLEFTYADGTPVSMASSPFARAVGGEVVRQLELRGRNTETGRVFHIVTGAAPVRDADGVVAAVVITSHDITERKRSEERLQQSNGALRQFAYAAAHDLQEPLRNVGLSSEMLARRYSKVLDPTGRQLLLNNVEGAQRMQRMVRDLLDYARVIDGGVGIPKDLNSADTLRDALAGFEETIKETGAVVEFADLPSVRMMRIHLLQLFQNLLSNSLKYRNPDKAPRIVIAAEQNLGETVFSVADNGIGFDPVHANRIFGLFRRLHGQREYAGTGLGLALCERIVAHYGGRIWAESTLGEGARFYFSIPAHRL